MIDMSDQDDFPEYERPNKSQMKRDAQALLELTKQILDLSTNQWSELALPIHIIDELHELKEMKQFGAKKRQMKRVAKLLRDVDVNVAKTFVETESLEHLASNAAFHRVEIWRDKLLSEGRGALTEFLNQNPSADAQHISQLTRNAKQEIAKGKAPKSSKLLFKYLRDLVV